MSIWYAIPVLGAGLLLLAVILWQNLRAPRLSVGERGILVGRGWGWIPWDEIEGAYPPSVGEADTVRLRLHVTERLARILRARRRPRVDAAVGDSVEIRLDLSDSDVNPVELLQEILSHSAPAR